MRHRQLGNAREEVSKILQMKFGMVTLLSFILLFVSVACTNTPEPPATATRLPTQTIEPPYTPTVTALQPTNTIDPPATPSATAPQSPTNTPKPPATSTTTAPVAQDISLAVPECDFQDQNITENVEIVVNGSLTLTVGSRPSLPCAWHPPAINDPNVLQQVDHLSKWPAEGVTPMPGAPGTEFWIFETLTEGAATISMECGCLGEEGKGQETKGIFVLNVTVKK